MTGRMGLAAWDVAYGVALAAGVLVFLVADLVPLRRFFLVLLTWVVAGCLVVFASGFAPRAPARVDAPEPKAGREGRGPTFSRWPASR